METYLSDIKLISLLQGEDSRDVEEAYLYLHKKIFASILKYVKNTGGGREEAKDAFTDAFIALYDNVKNRRFNSKSSLTTYLYSIAQRKWIDELRRRQTRKEKIEDLHSTTYFIQHTVDSGEYDDEKIEILEQILKQIPPKCSELLYKFYIQQLSHSEIAKEMEYADETVVRVTKSRCIKKIINLYENFFLESKKNTDY